MVEEKLSNLILSIYELAVRCEIGEFQEEVFVAVNKEISIDGAIWGAVAIVDGIPRPLHAFLYKWPAKLQADYVEMEVGSHDYLLQQTMEKPGFTIHGITDEVPDDAYLLKQFLKKYEIGSALGTTIFIPTLRINYAVALHRIQRNGIFNEEERQFKQALMPHLIEGYRQCRQFQIRRDIMKAWDEIHFTASADQSGVLHDAEDRFVSLLTSEWPDWQGARLPMELVERMDTAEPWRYRSERVDIQCRPLGDLWLLVGKLPGPLKALSARERSIAEMFSRGNSYSAIAEALNLAPSTVRNHLANVYGKLDVTNRTELLELVREDD